MGRSMRSYSGGKFGGNHTTIIEAACPVVDAAVKAEEVRRIVPGFINVNIGTGRHHIKFQPITGGLKVKVRGSSSLQEIYIYSSDPARTEQVLFRAFR
jgi:hypothetical protein